MSVYISEFVLNIYVFAKKMISTYKNIMDKPVMDRIELVLELVFCDEKYFQDLTLCQTKKVMLISKYSAKNKNIVNAYNKYKAWGVMNKISNILENAVEELISSDDDNESVAKELFSEVNFMTDDIYDMCKYNTAFKHTLAFVIMAEYKQNMHNRHKQFKIFFKEYFIHKLKICDNKKI